MVHKRADDTMVYVRSVIRVLSAACTAVVILAGCTPPPAVVNRAVTNIDFDWKQKNDKTLEEIGSRRVKASRYQAFVAAQSTLRRLGTVVEKQDLATGFLYATSAAPVPLSPEEWEIVKESDTTNMRRIAVEEVGYMGWFAPLDPASKDVLINVYVEERQGETEVSLGMRLRNRKDIQGLKKRTQPPPTALRIGLEKFWTVFEEELRGVVAEKLEVAPVTQAVTAAVARRADSPREPATRSAPHMSSQLTKQMCIISTGTNRSLDEVKETLVSEVKRLALVEFFGEVVSARSTVQDYVLSKSVVTGKSFGIVRTRGSPRFFNGTSLGEICVEGEFFITPADRDKLTPRTVSEPNFCYANEKLTLRALRESFRTEAISKTLVKVNPRLKRMDKSELVNLARNIRFDNERIDMATSALCADVAFEIVPLEVESYDTARAGTTR